MSAKHLALGLEPLMRVVLEDAARQVPGHGFDDMLRLAGLEQVGHYCVPEVVKPEAR